MSKYLFIGIDTGISGAIAVINEERQLIDLKDCPPTEAQMAAIIRGIHFSGITTFIEIEKVSHSKGWNASASMKLVDNFALWRGIFASFEIPYKVITAKQWQKGVITAKKFKKKKDETEKEKKQRKKKEKKALKARSLEAASRLFPSGDFFGPKGGGKDGRSDAALIADHCRSSFLRQGNIHKRKLKKRRGARE